MKLVRWFSGSGSGGQFNGWQLLTFVVAVFIAIPLFIVFYHIWIPGDDAWKHITSTLLISYLWNTLLLIVGTGLFTFILGTILAWITTMFEFPGRKFLSWALILPIALPAYISGFTWAGILDYTSPFYVWFRENWNLDTGAYLFFDILSMPGAIIIFSLVLYPYVYILVRTFFLQQSATFFDVAASAGYPPWQIFFRVALPLARPAIVAGVSLVIMEVINDYGLVHYYGIETFTTGIFSAWFNFRSPVSALKLAAFLLLIVFFLIWLERFQRRNQRFDTLGAQYRPVTRRKLRGWKGLMVLLISFFPLLPGFLIPFAMLIYWSGIEYANVVNYRFWELTGNSFILATIASFLVIIVAILLSFTLRTFTNRINKVLVSVSTLGYALPGAVVAVGILTLFIAVDAFIVDWFSANIFLTGSLFALIMAYLIRFLTVGYNNISTGFENISKNLDEASRSLGRKNLYTLIHIDLPLLRNALYGAFLLVFIDVLKELPLTLILRPFNFDTLAIRAFEFASDERIMQAAPASVIIVLTGIIPVILINRIMRKGVF
jgi:iron(III) transport system permease protein